MTCLEIPMRARDGSVRAVTLVDPDDAWVMDWRWTLNIGGYAIRNKRIDGRQRTFMLHREILGLTHDDTQLFGDHINGNRLDNRRANLRIANKSQNAQNQRRGWGKSQYRNVYLAANGRWRVNAIVNGAYHHLGYFDTEEEAARVAVEFRAAHMPFSPEAAAA